MKVILKSHYRKKSEFLMLKLLYYIYEKHRNISDLKFPTKCI